MRTLFTVACLGLLGGLSAACQSDRPHEYGEQRPPVTDLAEDDRGLQSKDVVDASDQLAQDLLATPKLNASGTQWTMVVTGVENNTTDPGFNYDIFTQRLKVNIARYGSNRVALIENRDRLHELRNREWEGGTNDQFGQTGGATPGAGAGIQPRYALYGKISEMPNRATSYYFAEFSVTDLTTRQIVWTSAYEVKVKR
jgi:hypothetical protein